MKKRQKFGIILLIGLVFVLLFSGCNLNFMGGMQNGGSETDMTPRLISLSGEQTTSDVVENVKSAIVGIRSRLSDGYAVGSGVAIREGGYILTNQHVISGSRGLTIYFADKTSATASLVWQDSSVDLAVIKSSKDMPYLECDTSLPVVGQDVIAIGTPLSLAFQHSVTKGIVSALNRTLEIPSTGGGVTYMQNLIQHDASINPGNSGGPLINLSGKVIGINTLKASDAEGIGFAIPIVTGEVIVNKLATNNGYTPPYMGVFGISSDYAKTKDMDVINDGLVILGVDSNSNAGIKGIQKGDVIYKIDDIDVRDFLDLRKIIYSHYVGDSMSVYAYRAGTPMVFELTLGE